MTGDADKAIRELVSRGIKIPPQPKVLLQLQKKLASNDYDVRSLARIISADPGISAMLFKAARAPAFGRGKRFDSLDQVIMVVGVKQTFNLVQAMALTTSVGDKSRKAFETFWTRSQEVADLAAMIAEDRVSVCNIFPDQAYMAGIFHECGVPVLMQRFPDYGQAIDLDRAACCPNLVDEDTRFNVDHCSIGYIVARHWNLPDFVCNAIRYHNELPTEEHGPVRSLVAILQLAIHYYHVLTNTADPLWHKIGGEVFAELGIHVDAAGDYQDDICERFLARS